MRGALRALSGAGWALLGLAALAGVAISAAAFLAVAPFARPAVARAVVGVIDEAIAGRLELEGIGVLPDGGIELRGLEVYDPDGHLVLSVGRARAAVDLRALARRRVRLSVELDAPSILLEEEAGGGVSLARAFAPAGPERVAPPHREPRADGGGWTILVSRLQIARGEVWWVDAASATRLDATGVELVARGSYRTGRARAEVRLHAELREPFEAPVALDLVAGLAGDALRVPVLHASAGDTEVELVAEGDLARRRGRAAVRRLGLSREQARAVLPATPPGADLGATGYVESDGATLTAALHVEPQEGAGRGGGGDAAVAARLEALARAAGFDLALDRLDPSRLVATAPEGALTLSARGAVAGRTIDDARARLALSVAPSRLGRGEISRAEVTLRAARGTVDVNRLEAALPGVALSASGTWRRTGALRGTATIDARDLARAARNVALLAGEKAPAIAGRARIALELGGTGRSPVVSGTVDAPELGTGSLRAQGVQLTLRGSGPLAALEGRLEGKAGLVREGGREVARSVVLRAAIQGQDGTVSASALVPGAGKDAIEVEARGRLQPRRESLLLGQLSLAYPRTRWSLVQPAMLDLRGPSVDRLELAAESQRIAISGGLGARGKLDARVELTRVDLARLPAGILPPEDGIAGVLSGTLDAGGTTRRPLLAGRVTLSRGAFRAFRGLDAVADARFDAAARRLAAKLSVARGEGGTVEANVDVPLPLGRRPAEGVAISVRAKAIPLEQMLAASGVEIPAAGTLSLEAAITGTAGAPSLSGQVAISEGAWRDLEGLAAEASVEAPLETARLTVSGSRAGRRVVGAEAEVPLDVSELLARPAEAVRALAHAPLEASVSVSALDLSELAGRAGLPGGIAGTLGARARVTGSVAAPRGDVSVDLSSGAWRGWRRLGAHVELAVADAGLTTVGRISIAGEEALRFDGSLGVRPERIRERGALQAAPLRVEAIVERVALGRIGAETVPLSGTIDGRLVASGTPRAPEVALDVAGVGVSLDGRPLGEVRATARYAARRANAELLLQPAAGGTLRATLGLAADLGLGAPGRSLREAPAEATVRADRLALGFLPAVAPAVIRSAGGELTIDVRAGGPLARLSPRGHVSLTGGRVAVAEYGEWTDIALEASVTDDAIEVARLEVRRGRGRLSADGALRGIRSEAAKLSAKLSADGFTIVRAGMDVATVDVEATATGSWRPGTLAVDVSVPGGVVRLPKKSPRSLQSLERRTDIVVGRRAERRMAAGPAAEAAGVASAPPFLLTAHVVVPRNLFVKSDSPRMDIELKADVRYELAGGQDYAEGSIEVVRGSVEPIGGRNFGIERGRVQFTGGPPKAALLDVEARYVNPAAVVTVLVAGPATAPEIRLSSDPPMDEGQIAMLIATGRTELKAGSGGVGTLTGEEAGRAALGALATQAFRDLVADKLPLDTVALDSGQLRAGKYVTDRIYVGYTRRFDADPAEGENENEVRVEYQISSRWTFESRYGNAQSGGASLIWSRQY